MEVRRCCSCTLYLSQVVWGTCYYIITVLNYNAVLTYLHFWGEGMILECGSPISQIMVTLRLILDIFGLIKNSLVTYM